MATDNPFVLVIDTPQNPAPNATNPDRIRSLEKFEHLFQKVKAGHGSGLTTVVIKSAGVRAAGTLTLSTASGTVGGIINGVTITVTASGGDTNTAALIAAAINASVNALVSGLVTATSALGVVTITAAVPGKTGNTMTLAASGTGVTASGTRLTAGAETSNTFTYSSSTQV